MDKSVAEWHHGGLQFFSSIYFAFLIPALKLASFMLWKGYLFANIQWWHLPLVCSHQREDPFPDFSSEFPSLFGQNCNTHSSSTNHWWGKWNHHEDLPLWYWPLLRTMFPKEHGYIEKGGNPRAVLAFYKTEERSTWLWDWQPTESPNYTDTLVENDWNSGRRRRRSWRRQKGRQGERR